MLYLLVADVPIAESGYIFLGLRTQRAAPFMSYECNKKAPRILFYLRRILFFCGSGTRARAQGTDVKVTLSKEGPRVPPPPARATFLRDERALPPRARKFCF